MDKEKEQAAKKRFEEMKKKVEQEAEKEKNQQEEKPEIPRDAFRKNLGCGG
ncbi:hypothetical protein [Marinoscillum pacificum]|uniref:hypothetical protein n=1 Tax=Marinoscillum pacificum TaxID=392723 RepID=UPI002157B0AA|nr:hypothetical protein [Marinoscillum pacificum]